MKKFAEIKSIISGCWDESLWGYSSNSKKNLFNKQNWNMSATRKPLLQGTILTLSAQDTPKNVA